MPNQQQIHEALRHGGGAPDLPATALELRPLLEECGARRPPALALALEELLLESRHGLATVDDVVSILFEYHGILLFSKNVLECLRFFDESFAGPVNSAEALPSSEMPVEARRGSAREVFRRVSSRG
jgi:hypothetical protein